MLTGHDMHLYITGYSLLYSFGVAVQLTLVGKQVLCTVLITAYMRSIESLSLLYTVWLSVYQTTLLTNR